MPPPQPLTQPTTPAELAERREWVRPLYRLALQLFAEFLKNPKKDVWKEGDREGQRWDERRLQMLWHSRIAELHEAMGETTAQWATLTALKGHMLVWPPLSGVRFSALEEVFRKQIVAGDREGAEITLTELRETLDDILAGLEGTSCWSRLHRLYRKWVGEPHEVSAAANYLRFAGEVMETWGNREAAIVNPWGFSF